MDASSEKNILGYDTYFLHSLEKGFPTKLWNLSPYPPRTRSALLCSKQASITVLPASCALGKPQPTAPIAKLWMTLTSSRPQLSCGSPRERTTCAGTNHCFIVLSLQGLIVVNDLRCD